MEQQLKRIMSNVFSIKKSNINEFSSMDNIGQWDSLKHMELITAIEQYFGIMLAANEITEMTSMANIKKVLCTRLVNARRNSENR